MKNTHGGKRIGSGRKPDPNKKIRYATRLSPRIIEIIRNHKLAGSVLIEKAVEYYIKRKKV